MPGLAVSRKMSDVTPLNGILNRIDMLAGKAEGPFDGWRFCAGDGNRTTHEDKSDVHECRCAHDGVIQSTVDNPGLGFPFEFHQRNPVVMWRGYARAKN